MAKIKICPRCEEVVEPTAATASVLEDRRGRIWHAPCALDSLSDIIQGGDPYAVEFPAREVHPRLQQPPADLTRPFEYDFDSDRGLTKSDRALPVGQVRAFIFDVPHNMHLQSIAFGGDYEIRDVTIGAQVLLGGNREARVPASDYPDLRFPVERFVPAGLRVQVVLAARGKDDVFSARVIGLRSQEVRKLREPKSAEEALVGSPPPRSPLYQSLQPVAESIETAPIAPGEVRMVIFRSQLIFRIDRLVSDDPGAFELTQVEVARDPVLDSPLRLERETSLPLPTIKPAEEVRFFVKNISPVATAFRVRLHGSAAR